MYQPAVARPGLALSLHDLSAVFDRCYLPLKLLLLCPTFVFCFFTGNGEETWFVISSLQFSNGCESWLKVTETLHMLLSWCHCLKLNPLMAHIKLISGCVAFNNYGLHNSFNNGALLLQVWATDSPGFDRPAWSWAPTCWITLIYWSWAVSVLVEPCLPQLMGFTL